MSRKGITNRYSERMQTELVLSAQERLRFSRLRAGLDQFQMADILGVHRAAVSAYENGRTEPTLSKLVRWADAADVSLDWLCARRDSNPQPSDWESERDIDAPPCYYCGSDDHTTDDCPEPTGLARPERFSTGDREPVCFVCGGPHDLDDCPRGDDLDDALEQLLAGVA